MNTRFRILLTVLAVLVCSACRPCAEDFETRALPPARENTNPRRLVKTPEQEASLSTLSRLDSLGELYSMDYSADYCLDRLLDTGVRSNGELLGFANSVLLASAGGAEGLSSDFGCSSFLVRGSDGHCLFCRNFDYAYRSPVSVVVRTKGTIGTFNMNMAVRTVTSGSVDDGTSDTSFYVAAPLAMVDGMNESGLAISVLVVHSYGAEQHAEGKGNITTTAIIREILDRATDVDGALALFDSHNFFAHGGGWKSNYHFFVADASGRSVVVEYVNSGRDNREDRDYRKVVTECPYVTNNYICEAFRNPVDDSWREALIASRIDGVQGKADAFRLLLDVSQYYDEDLKRSLKEGETAGPNSYPETLWSLVYDLTARECYIITGRELMQGKAPFRLEML